MKIYFERGALHPLSEFLNMVPPTVIINRDGYKNMIADAKIALHNKWNIYTNDISLLGASELFGEKFLHDIMIRNDKSEWVKFNPYILKKLEKPITIEQYFRRYVCKN